MQTAGLSDMLKEIQRRLVECETWKQPHEDITWLLDYIYELNIRIEKLEAACDSVLRTNQNYGLVLNELDAPKEILEGVLKAVEVALYG